MPRHCAIYFSQYLRKLGEKHAEVQLTRALHGSARKSCGACHLWWTMRRGATGARSAGESWARRKRESGEDCAAQLRQRRCQRPMSAGKAEPAMVGGAAAFREGRCELKPKSAARRTANKRAAHLPTLKWPCALHRALQQAPPKSHFSSIFLSSRQSRRDACFMFL